MGAATFFTYNVYRPTREPLHRLAGITTAANGCCSEACYDAAIG